MKNKRIKVLYIVFFIASVFFAAFVLAEFRKDYLAVALAAIVMLIAAYFLVDKIERDIFQRYELDKRSFDDKMDEVTGEIRRGNDKIDFLSEAIMQASMQGLTEPKQKFNQFVEELTTAEQTLQQQEDLITKHKDKQDSDKELEKILKTQRETITLIKTGFKTLIQFSKENSRQVALNTNQNSEQLLKDLTLVIQQLTVDLPKIVNESLEDVENKIESMSEAYVENISLVSLRLEKIEELMNEISESLKA
jgi:hypothetical protein